MNAIEIKNKLIELGGREWAKGGHHRVYIESQVAVDFIGSEHAEFGKKHTVYFDVARCQFVCANRRVEDNLNVCMEEMN